MMAGDGMNTFAYIKVLEKADISVRAKWLGVLLYNYAGKRGYTGMTHRQLMRSSSLSQRTVIRAINELIEAGLMAKTPGHEGWATVYKPQWTRVSNGDGRVSNGDGKASQDVTPLKENTSSASSADADTLRFKRLQALKKDGIQWATLANVDDLTAEILTRKEAGATYGQAVVAMIAERLEGMTG
jgi:DNA-binding transcriptional MocR family regulator